MPPPSFGTRATACGALTIAASGSTLLGGHVAFTSSAGASLAGYIVGGAVTAPPSFCSGCAIGASGTTVIGGTFRWSIPLDPELIGGWVAVQAFAFASPGPCLGQIRLGDTVDFDVQ